MIISLILIILSATFDAERDKIQFNPKKSLFPNWEFWITRNYMEKKGAGWLFDNALSWLNDGWHLCKWVHLITLIAGSFLIPHPIYLPVALVAYGVVFTVIYAI